MMAEATQVVLMVALGVIIGELLGIFMALVGIKDVLEDWFRRNGR